MSNLNVLENVSLAPYTTFKIGGPAKYFFEAKSKEEILEIINWAHQKNLPYFILGGGSNVLFSDNGFDGLVIKIKNLRLEIKDSIMTVGAGVSLSQLIQIALENSLTGLEWAVGIPGTIGGAVRGNAGAMGLAMADIVKEVEFLDEKGKIRKWNKNQCRFGYRDSIFKKNPKWIILSAKIKLKKGDRKEIQKKMEENLAKRENQPKEPSAGCIFKNIEIKNYKNEYQKWLQKYPEIKNLVKNGKLPAAWFIEQCDLKGKQIGRAKISEKHANFIVNLDEAKAEDVIILISLIKQKVRNEFGIQLQEEIEMIFGI
jgi:UDP-N-acetylmuramate dehydrogenase